MFGFVLDGVYGDGWLRWGNVRVYDGRKGFLNGAVLYGRNKEKKSLRKGWVGGLLGADTVEIAEGGGDGVSTEQTGSSLRRLADVLDQVPPEFRKICFSLPSDAVVEEQGRRKTKIVATIGPSTRSEGEILRLAAGGVNLIRLNMSHGNYEWHREVLRIARKINVESPFVLGTMVDIGSLDTIRLGEFNAAPVLEKGDPFTLTVRHEASYPLDTSEVSYDGFIDVAAVGDHVQIAGEGGDTIELLIKKKNRTDAVCEVLVPGVLKSRAGISIRGKSYRLLNSEADETPCEVDSGCHPLSDMEFAISERVDYISLAFVESPQTVHELRDMLRERGVSIGIVSKIESPGGLNNMKGIIQASDAVMVARGDLGTTIPYEKVPVWQEKIVRTCRELGKPCMVSTHFLESMVMYPTPTRAEVTDIAEAVKQRTDALVLTTETASGKYPFKALATMNAVALRMEEQLNSIERKDVRLGSIFESQSSQEWWSTSATKIAENIASSAALLSSRLNPRAILVFTQKGLMASLLSRTRPHCPVFAFTAKPSVRSRLALLYGVRPFRMEFCDDPEETIARAMEILKIRQMVQSGDTVLVVADVLGGAHGAPESEIRKVYDDLASASRGLNRARLRPALRRLGLKASDAVEANMGMSDVDLLESELESGANSPSTNDHGNGTSTNGDSSTINFPEFQAFVGDAVEIVHTVQLRVVE